MISLYSTASCCRACLRLLPLLLLTGCATSRAYYQSDTYQETTLPDTGEVYQILLIGDTGAPEVDGTDPVLALLDAHLQRAGDSSAVVFLGDNIYPRGLPRLTDDDRREAERHIDVQLDVLRDYPGRVFFVPGNHDWDDSGRDGWAGVRREEDYIETALGRGDVFVPSGGLPGPVTIDLPHDIRLIAIDSQWWMHPFAKPFGDSGDYSIDEPADFMVALQDLVEESEDYRVLMVAHHPLASNSSHAGVFAPKFHLFPLTKTVPGAYLPLPVLGSVLLFYNRILGLTTQDLSHPTYEAYRLGITDIIGRHDGLVYAAGHEHNLQYFAQPGTDGTQHLLVSGSGSKSDYARTGGTSLFATRDRGFMKLRYYADGSVWLEAYTVADGDTPIYRALLDGADESAASDATPSRDAPPPPSFADSTVVAAINPDYRAGWLRQTFIGEGYRDVWTEPLTFPVLDLGREAGGLTPLQRGGGMQTRSIRLANPDGKEYVLRSVDKYPAATVPEAFRFGLAMDIAEEMTTAIHPFAALVAAALADSAGLYHANPRIVYVPDDPRLGRFREEFRDKIMLLEERPDDDQRDAPFFGNSENVIGADKLFRELQGDNDHFVDQRMFLRARLLDLLIGDWDRHRDQWRWASFEPFELDSTLTGDARTQGKIYQPVPRDRDWAFNNRDGLLFKLARPFVPKLQGLQEDYGNLNGLTTNGSEQDQRFLNDLSREEWHAEVDSLLARLTDEAIEGAVRAFPPEVYALDGARFARLLKKRRDKLHRVADAYYETRATVVDVVGSDKHERFEVHRLPGDKTEVVMLKTGKEGDVRMELYRRTFFHDETREIRLYGLGGNDTFEVDGDVRGGIPIRLIGGTGEDVFRDRSRVSKGFQPKTYIYDAPTEINPVPDVEGGPETKFRRADRYPQLALGVVPQRYDQRFPLLYVFSNAEDGLFVGGGFRWIRQGFLKEPYARMQMLRANVAPLTGAFNTEYRGHFVQWVGRWDMGLDVSYRSPLSIRNYYGLGNNLEIADPGNDFYRTRMTEARFAPNLSRTLLDVARLFIGPSITYTQFKETPDRFLSTPAAGVPDDVFDGLFYTGANVWLVLDSRDDRVMPRRGFTTAHSVEGKIGLQGESPFLRLTSEMTAYLTAPSARWFTLAPRIGYEHNIGDFPFYLANTLGGKDNLRGYRSDRFAGRTAFYQNVEARVQLKRFEGYVGRGELGLLAFADNGRVWADGEASGTWHQGYGGGLWVGVLGQFVFNVQTAFSREDRLVTFGLDWFY